MNKSVRYSILFILKKVMPNNIQIEKIPSRKFKKKKIEGLRKFCLSYILTQSWENFYFVLNQF